jgi:hypothetical protein
MMVKRMIRPKSDATSPVPCVCPTRIPGVDFLPRDKG